VQTIGIANNPKPIESVDQFIYVHDKKSKRKGGIQLQLRRRDSGTKITLNKYCPNKKKIKGK